VLGGRYTAARRLEQFARAERWSAHDTTLERAVVVVCFPAADPNADAALDAARRAAGIDNHRLVRILDVGRADDVAFFVEEALPHSHTLTALVADGGLPSEEARRIAGEVATALEVARSRGLHHLRLTPSSVVRTADGTVKLSGLATAAALSGVEEPDAVAASRTDAVGVVAITYAALTSRWPLSPPVVGLDRAPHIVGGVPAPSEIAAGVPGDLDALCRLTLNEDEGPLTPGDFAVQIAPWSPTEVAALGGPPHASRGRTEESAGSSATTVAMPVQRPTPPPRSRDDEPLPGEGSELPAARRGPVRSGAAEQEGGGAGTGAAVAGAVTTVIGTAGHAAGHAAEAAVHKVGTFARAAADRAAEKRAARAEAEEQQAASRISLDDALLAGREEIEPPLPLLPPETAVAPSRDQSKLVVAILAAFVVVATVLGFWGVSHIGSGSGLDLTGTTPTPTRTVTTAPPSTTPTTSPSTTTSAPATHEPLAIHSVKAYDPEGDGSEHNSELGRIYDGKASTFWSSDGYASSSFGGLKKGVGVVVDLGQPAKVHQVVLTLPDASDVTVYVGDSASRGSATEIGSSRGKKGEVTFSAKGDGAAGQYVIVWFTKISQVSDGRFRATLAEVAVS
jgi:hypothetical protein